MRRHRLIERFLTDVLGVPWDEVHEEAERLEHAMSPVLEERMRAAIGDAKTCPHGHPIVAGARLAGVPLADVESGASVRILRFENEAEDLLHYLKSSGLEPGLDGRLVERDDEQVVVQAADGSRCVRHAERRRDRLGDRRPFTARAHGPAGSARPRPALRPLTDARGGAILRPRSLACEAGHASCVLVACLSRQSRSASAEGLQGPVGGGEARNALVDLLGRDSGEGETQGVRAALEQEVAALHEGHAEFAGGRCRPATSVPCGSFTHMK